MREENVAKVEGMRRALVSLGEICKVYGKGETATHALKGVSLSVEAGEFLAILGPSGCGKTTLLNIIGGVDNATSGTFFFDGQNLSNASERALTAYRRREVGFIFQSYNLIPTLTAKENVRYIGGLVADPLPAEEALRRLGLSDRADYFPAQLSGGQQQRVSIACAISKRPRILLADEPTGALDDTTGQEVLRALEEVVRQGTTLVMVTHNESIAERADRVARMSDGTLKEVVTNGQR